MGMTLEEAIAHYLKIAEENEKDAEQFKRIKATQDMISHCYECAKEHRQLAEWLRELKIHREIHDILLQTFVDFDLDICCDDLMDNEEEQKICEENCGNKTKSCWVRWAKMKAREVTADENSD